VAPGLHGWQEKPKFRARTELIQVEASVLDKGRRPVRGLTAEDFVVRENGKPQQIEAFSEFDLPSSEKSGIAWFDRAPFDVETNDSDKARLVAIVLDDAMIPQEPSFVRQTKLIGREIVNRLGPRDAASVVFTRDNRSARSFTSDHAKLLAAIDAFNGGPAFFQPDDYPLWVASEITVSDVADALIAQPNRRKVLVLVSVGIGIYPQLEATTTEMRDSLDVREKQIRLHDLLQDTLNRARRANVAIYTFDPGGVGGLPFYCRNGGGRCPLPSIRLRPSEQFPAFRDYLTTLPANTGGRPNFADDPIAGIDEMFAENQSFYLLGYRQSTPAKAGEYRRLEVTVKRKGVDVRSSNMAYREPTADERALKLREPQPTSGAKALASVLPDGSIPLRLNLIPLASTTGTGATVVVAVGVTEPRAEETLNQPLPESLHMLMRAFTMDGAPRAERSSTVSVRLETAASSGQSPVTYEVIGRLDIAKPGAYTVRVGIDAKAQSMAASVFADLDVPDFTSALALSGVAIGQSRGSRFAEGDLQALLPFLPTTLRTFSSNDRVSALLYLYEAKDNKTFPVNVRTVIRDKADAAVYDRNESLPAERFGLDRRADVRLELPLETLAAGPFLLTFEATHHDKSIRRDVVFNVR
jgi:VWFA-related protein